jgi:hypothetical protein
MQRLLNLGALVRPSKLEPKLRPYQRAPYAPSRILQRSLAFFLLAVFCLIYGFIYALMAAGGVTIFAAPVAVLALLVIWALPETDRAPVRSIEIFLFSFLVVLAGWPNYLALALPGLPWITFQRLTLAPLLLLLLICLSTSPTFRANLKSALSKSPYIWIPLVAFLGYQAISILYSGQKSFSIQRVIVNQMSVTSVFVAAVCVLLKPRMITRWAALIWILAVVDSAIGVLEFFEGHVLWAGHIPPFLAVGDDTVARILAGAARLGSGKYRIQSVFGTPLTFGEYIALTMPFVLHFALNRYHWLVRLAAVATVPLFFFDVIAADTRLGFIGCLMSLGLTLLTWGLLRWREMRASLVGPAVVLAYPMIAAVGLLASFSIGSLRVRVWGGGAQQYSTQGRDIQWAMGWPKIFHAPWGHGIATNGTVLGFFAPGADFPTVDSYYLTLLLDYGFIGYGLFLATFVFTILASLFYGVLHDDRDKEVRFLIPVAIALTNFLVIKSVLSQEDNLSLAFMMVGAGVALIARARARSQADVATTPLATPPVGARSRFSSLRSRRSV